VAVRVRVRVRVRVKVTLTLAGEWRAALRLGYARLLAAV
jgi:hypothetical protein